MSSAILGINLKISEISSLRFMTLKARNNIICQRKEKNSDSQPNSTEITSFASIKEVQHLWMFTSSTK